MRRAYASFLIITMLVLLGNALLPFLAQKSDNILICTSEGYRYVSAAEAGMLPPPAPDEKHRQHCVMCVIAAQSQGTAPSLNQAEIVTPASTLLAYIIPSGQHAIPCSRGTASAPRAPPVLS